MNSSLHFRDQRCIPDVSVVVVVYNIPREAPRTLLSLSPGYQRHIASDEYEVIVVDNGSEPPLDPQWVARFGANFRLIRIDAPSPSPAPAVNRGIAEARGEVVGVMIDGARIVTPGLLHFARHGARLYDCAVVAALGWYLGYDFQRWAMQCGYNQVREDALLVQIGWPEDGYRLFEIATLDESSVEGWFYPIAETNALFMQRELWQRLRGLDERFDLPGGGLVNLDAFQRAIEMADARLVLLLGEGTFHQLHGGIATNMSPEQQAEGWGRWAGQYERIRGRPYRKPTSAHPPTYLGILPRPALAHFVRAAIAPVRADVEPPLGRDFDHELWSVGSPAIPANPAIAGVVQLAQQEFRAGRYAAAVSLARLARGRAPDETEPQRLLSLIATALDQGGSLDAEYYLALGEAQWLLDEKELAQANYQTALSLEPSLAAARAGLARLANAG